MAAQEVIGTTNLGNLVLSGVGYDGGANTAITTAGNGTLTGAALASQVVTRSGPTGAYTDTTDTAANIIKAIPNGGLPVVVGTSWIVHVINSVAFVLTLAAGTGVTLSGTTSVSASSTRAYLVTVTGVGASPTVTIQGLMQGAN